MISWNKWGKFLKKLWCCVSGEYYRIICHATRHQPIAQIHLSVYKPPTKHNSSIRSDVGLTLETSTSESLYGGQFTLSTQLIDKKKNSLGRCLVNVKKKLFLTVPDLTSTPVSITRKVNDPSKSAENFVLFSQTLSKIFTFSLVLSEKDTTLIVSMSIIPCTPIKRRVLVYVWHPYRSPYGEYLS